MFNTDVDIGGVVCTELISVGQGVSAPGIRYHKVYMCFSFRCMRQQAFIGFCIFIEIDNRYEKTDEQLSVD